MIKRLILAGLLLTLAAVAQAGPEIQHWQTGNGMAVYFVRAPELPMLDLRVTFDAGSARDGDLPGLARLTNGALQQGAGGLSADEIAERFARVGAQFDNGALRDMAWLSLRTLTDPEYIRPALDTFATVLWHPDFKPRDMARLQRQALVSLADDAAQPEVIASNAFFRALYGDHPYGHPMKGTPESVKRIGPQQMRDFYRRYYVAANGLIALVGDIDRATAEKMAETLSQGLPRGAHAPPLPPVPPLEKARTVRIPFPSRQAHVFIGQPGVARGDPDHYALYLGNHVLGGGGFTSRLVKEVRVKRGYAYSVYSYFLPMRAPGPFQIVLQTRGDQADDAVRVARQTLERYLREGPSAGELKAAKQNITGSIPLRMASNASIADYLGMIGFYGLPLDYLDSFTGHIEAQTRDDVLAALRRHLHPERMVTVIVGGESR